MDLEKPTTPTPSEVPDRKPDWARTALWLGVSLIVVAGLVLTLRACFEVPERALRQTEKTVQRAGEALASVAAAFRQGTISTSFVSYATTLTNSQRLQFATLKQMEIFTRTEEPTTAFGYVPLPDVIVEARAPVEYTYYLDLNGTWNFVLRDGVITVLAPPIHANKPAVDVSAITYEVKRGRFKSAEALENLKKSISSLVVLKAKENIPLVRETGRRETADFIERWLAQSFADGKKYPVKVYFPGESSSERVPMAPPASK